MFLCLVYDVTQFKVDFAPSVNLILFLGPPIDRVPSDSACAVSLHHNFEAIPI